MDSGRASMQRCAVCSLGAGQYWYGLVPPALGQQERPSPFSPPVVSMVSIPSAGCQGATTHTTVLCQKPSFGRGSEDYLSHIWRQQIWQDGLIPQEQL